MFDAGSRTRRSFLGAVASGTVAAAGPQTAAAPPEPSRSTRTIRAGTPDATEVYTYDSGVPGPTVFVVGGIHGNERAGYLAADDIATGWTVPAGRLIVVPRANVPAIQDETREGLTGDLNRQFPPLQAPESPLARAIWNEIAVADPDLFVDLHEARTLHGDGGIAQTLGYYPVQNVRDMAGEALRAVNETVSNPNGRFQRRIVPGPLEHPQGPLVKRLSLERTGPAYITETYRERPLADRIAQQKRLVRVLVEERMQTFAGVPDWNHLYIKGQGSPVEYEFTASGRIRKNRWSSIESRDLVLGDRAFGTVSASEWDRYEYAGSLEAFALLSGRASDVEVFVNGRRRSLPGLALPDAREIRVLGSGARVDYEFGVTGDILKSRSLRVDASDVVWNDRANGYVVDAGDAYRFTGRVAGFAVTSGDPSDIAILVDGTPRSIGSLNPPSTRTITLERLGSPVEYQFLVDGTVLKNGRDSNDRIFGPRAFGTVDQKPDSYRFTGNITALEVTAGSESDLRVTVDGESRSLASFRSYPPW